MTIIMIAIERLILCPPSSQFIVGPYWPCRSLFRRWWRCISTSTGVCCLHVSLARAFLHTRDLCIQSTTEDYLESSLLVHNLRCAAKITTLEDCHRHGRELPAHPTPKIILIFLTGHGNCFHLEW